MWMPTPENRDGKNQGSSFLLAVWTELFDPFTPDSFQPRIHNVASLCDELCDVSFRLDDSSIWWQHIRQIRDELAHAVDEEQSLLTPEHNWLLQKLLSASNVRDVQIYSRLTAERSQSYKSILLDKIRLGTAELPRQKERAYASLRRLATIAVQSSKEDDDVLTGLPGFLASPEEIMDVLITKSMEAGVLFDCVFAVAGKHGVVRQVVERVGLRICKPDPLPKDKVDQIQCAINEVFFVTVSVEARSRRDAVNKSRKQLGVGVDILNLYSNSEALRVLDDVFIKRANDDEFSTFSQSEQAFRRLQPRNRAAEDTAETIKSISQNRLEDRVLSALELHSMAMSSSEPRVKLINFWSALECLAGCHEAESIYHRVVNLVCPLLAWRRVDKVVRYTAIQTKKYADTIDSYSFGPGFRKRTNHYVHPWDMMLALCRPKDHDHICELLRFAGGHPLLVFRLYRLWKELHNPKSLKATLESSYRRIEWQLRRIYRARNLLVHHGVEVPMLGSLLDNLQYYASITIQRIIHGMKFGPNWGVRESMAYWSAKHNYVMSRLAERPSDLRVSDFFPVEGHDVAPPLWT